MIFRQILAELDRWKHLPTRKPLVLRGARQVGKTTTIHLFGKTYPQYLYVNLENRLDFDAFEKFSSATELVQSLFFAKGLDLKKQTLLFIDEIQQSPRAVQMLRYLYEDVPALHVVAAGSLLETIFDQEINFPVGRVEYRVLRPLSFIEFLHGIGETQAVAVMSEVPLPQYAFDKLLGLFHQYTTIGGMPEVVSEFIRTRDMTQLPRIYEGLLVSYLEDVEKYAKSQASVQTLRAVIRSAFAEAGKRITFQGFGHSDYKSRDIGEAFRTLEKAMILQLVYPTTEMALPLSPDHKRAPRLQVLDTGLLNSYSGIQKGLFAIKDLNDLYQGIVAEHIVGQELLAMDFSVLNTLLFWVRDKNQSSAEIDFILKYNGMIIPVEVKSGKTGTLRSLILFMEQVEHPYAVRFYAGQVKMDVIKTPKGKTFRLLNLPYFLTSRISTYLDWMMNQS